MLRKNLILDLQICINFKDLGSDLEPIKKKFQDLNLGFVNDLHDFAKFLRSFVFEQEREGKSGLLLDARKVGVAVPEFTWTNRRSKQPRDKSVVLELSVRKLSRKKGCASVVISPSSQFGNYRVGT